MNKPIACTLVTFALTGVAVAVAGCCSCHKDAPATHPAAAGANAREAPVIVRLVGRDTTVTITASDAGPRYSATTRTGETIATNLTLDELRDRHPDVYRFVHPADALANTADATDTARPASSVTGGTWAGLEGFGADAQ